MARALSFGLSNQQSKNFSTAHGSRPVYLRPECNREHLKVALIPTRAGRPFLFPRFQPVYDAVGNNEKIYHVALTQFGAVCDRQSTREKIGDRYELPRLQ
jgi:hypothetical protein